MDNREILRGVITTPDIGTPGYNLLSPEQGEAFWVLSEEKHPWAALQGVMRRTAHTGSVPRIDFGGTVIEPATEAVDTGTFTEPDYSNVAYVLKKGRVAFSVSFEGVDQAAEPDHENTLVDGFTRAFGRNHQELAWLGDEAIVVVDARTKMLSLNDGWLKIIHAGGALVDGSGINGGDLAPAHFFAALRQLPIAWKQRKRELRWAIGSTHLEVLAEYLSGRATGVGDEFLRMGANGEMIIAGVEAVEVPSLTTDICLTHPDNTTVVRHPREFRLKRIDTGLEVEAADIVAWLGFFRTDYVLREVEGTVNIHTLETGA